MGDLIDRQAAIDALNKLKIYRPLDSDRYVISDCLNKIVNLPSAQPEIIRCKDCKHRYIDEKFGPSCELDTGDPYATGRDAHKDNWFCADAERKTDG